MRSIGNEKDENQNRDSKKIDRSNKTKCFDDCNKKRLPNKSTT